MPQIAIRPMQDHELPAVARLRWDWVVSERERQLVVTRAEFVQAFVDWAGRNTATHRCTVLARDDVIIGMAWLAIVRRVPSPRSLDRISGDVQCVYVVPEERNAGLGGQLIDAVVATARQLGCERVTVHSSDGAITAYTRHGFTAAPTLLQAVTDGTSVRSR